MTGPRLLLAATAAALLLVLSLTWAAPGEVGWAAYEPDTERIGERIAAVFADTDQRGWAVLGGWAVPPAVLAVGLLVAAARPPGPRGLAGLAVLALAAVAAISLGGFAPAAIPVPPLGIDFPRKVERVTTWAPAGALLAVALALATIGLAARRRVDRPAPLLVAGAVLFAGALLLGWEGGLGPSGTDVGNGFGSLGWLAAPVVVLAAGLAALAFRPAPKPALAALFAVAVAAALILARGFRGGLADGPYCALLGLGLGALGLMAALLPARARPAPLAAAAGALAIAATPFVPWGLLGGPTYVPYGAGPPGGPGFPTAFAHSGGLGPLLCLPVAACVLALALAPPRRLALIVASGVCLFAIWPMSGFVADPEVYGATGPRVAIAGVALTLAGLLGRLGEQAARSPQRARRPA